jgi:hypothetical protein
MATFNRTDSRLLSEISWHTNLILGPEDLQDADFQVHSFFCPTYKLMWIVLQAYFLKVIEADGELSGSSIEVKAARKVLQMEPGATGNMNELHLYKAVNRVLAYRILDVCQWIKSKKPSLNSNTVPVLVESQRDLLQELVRAYTFFILRVLGQLPPF